MDFAAALQEGRRGEEIQPNLSTFPRVSSSKASRDAKVGVTPRSRDDRFLAEYYEDNVITDLARDISIADYGCGTLWKPD